VPNAAVDALGFAAIAVLALRKEEDRRDSGRRRAGALAALAGSATVAGASLTWEQGARIGAWCFWCLLSAALGGVIFPLAAIEATASRAWRG